MTENFTNLIKEKKTQVQEVQRVPNKMYTKKPAPRHNIIKMEKVKDTENLKTSKRKTVTNKGTPIRRLVDFSTETFQARRDIGTKYTQ